MQQGDVALQFGLGAQRLRGMKEYSSCCFFKNGSEATVIARSEATGDAQRLESERSELSSSWVSEASPLHK